MIPAPDRLVWTGALSSLRRYEPQPRWQSVFGGLVLAAVIVALMWI